MQSVWVRSLVQELRSHMPHSAPPNQKKGYRHSVILINFKAYSCYLPLILANSNKILLPYPQNPPVLVLKWYNKIP